MERPLTSKAVSKANLPCKCRQWGFAYSDLSGTSIIGVTLQGQPPKETVPVPGKTLGSQCRAGSSGGRCLPPALRSIACPEATTFSGIQCSASSPPRNGNLLGNQPARAAHLRDTVDAVWWWFRGGGAPDLEPDEAAKACAPIQSKPGLGRRFDRDAETPALWPVHRAQGPSRGPAPPSRRVCPPAAWVRLSISSNAKASESRRMLCPGQAGEREAAGPLAAACRRGTEDAKQGRGWARPRLRISK